MDLIEKLIQSRKDRHVELAKLIIKHEENNEKKTIINLVLGQKIEVLNTINQLECIRRFGCTLEEHLTNQKR